MKRLKKWLISALSFAAMLAVGTGIASVPQTAISADAAEGYQATAYVPSTADEYDPYGAMGDIDPADGDGVTTFAHSGLSTPLEGANISMNTSFTLLPQTTTDGWLTYSFTSSPITADSQIPNYGANAKGIFFHITNYSSASAPNCVEVQFVQNNGSNGGVASSVFLDNAVGVAINFSLAKQTDGTYTWTITRLSDNVVLKTVSGIAFTESLFVNENGQTYFSTALFESENGNAAANRGVNVYSVQKYEYDTGFFLRDYAPTTDHEYDSYGAMKNLEAGGVTTFAHSGLSTPLEGANIDMDTSFTLLPKTTTDGWLTYSFTSSPVTADSEIPNYMANAKGIFFHITNISSASASNCVEVQFVQNNGSNTSISSVYLDNAIGEKINFSLAKQSDGTYTWTITKLSDGTVLKTVTGLAFTESLFVNEKGQTYFSTALFGSEVNGVSAGNRGIDIYSIGLYDGAMTAMAYKPETSDMKDLFHTVSVYKGSVSYYGHTALKMPLDGENISLTSTFSLLSAKAKTEGGDGIDGWVTYSFSPTMPTQESEIPHASGTAATGLYFQLTNVSGTSAANCVQMYVGYKVNGTVYDLVGSAFVNNIIGYNWTISLTKTATNTFAVAFVNNETGITAWSETITINEDYIINKNGQTYFSSAIYGSSVDGVAKGNRYVYLHSVDARVFYGSTIDVEMEAEEYVYTYGSSYKPVQSVSLNGTKLTERTDYTVTYVYNDQPGTATVRIAFLGEYYALPEYIKTFEIKEASSDVAELQTVVDALQASFKMQEGAAVKLSNPTGLRFGADLDVDALNALKNYAGVTNVVAGTIIIPYENLKVGELPRIDSGRTADAENVEDRILIIPCTVLDSESFNGTFYGAITDIYEENCNRQFAGRAYISYTYGEKTYTIYAKMDDNVRSVNYVAYSALLDETKDYGNGETILQDYVDYAQANYGDDIQYVTYMITNKSVNEIEPYIQRMVAIHGENDPTSGRMYAFGIPGPFPLSQSVAQMQAMVDKAFTLAEQYNVPVFFQIDDMTNYIDFSSYASGQFGDGALVKFYEHPEMCEWVQFPTAGEEYGGQNDYGRLPRWYFNWGDEASTTAVPNLASTEFRELLKQQLQEGFLKPLAAKMKTLTEAGKGYLFAGCNIGWETQIPDYSEDSYLCAPSKGNIVTLETWEQTEYGYAALHTLGYTADKLATEAAAAGVSVDEYRKTILYGVMQDFIEFVAKLVYDAGVPRDLIYTHTIANGTKNSTYDTMMPPVWVAVNDYSTPGYTMANSNWNQETLETELAKVGASTYIIAEGYKSGYDGSVNAAKTYFEEQFGGNCRNITVFGYDEEDTTDTSADYFEQAVERWLAKEILPE